jgi:hypothetical protein
MTVIQSINSEPFRINKYATYSFLVHENIITGKNNIFLYYMLDVSQSQWSCSLMYELTLSDQTLGLWVRITLKTWMFVCVYSVFVLSCVDSGLVTGCSPVQGVLPTVSMITKL